MPIVGDDFPEKISIYSGTLRKFTGAQVDPYTRYVAYTLFQELNVPVQGQRNINSALSNLPIHVSIAPDEKLSFGWGRSHVMHDRVVHEGSYEHLAVMIALGESFHENYGAQVLSELAKAAAGPDDTTPHFSQWKAALHACNGAFATTDFGLLVEEYIHLYPYPLVSARRIDDIFPPRVLADALQALMRVTSGKEKEVTFTCSAIGAWIGAIAEWLCDLQITVYHANGEQLHKTHPDREPQLTIVFVREPGLQFSFDPHSQNAAGIADLSLVDHTYPAAVHATPFGGRVAWQSLLPRVFGRSFHILDHEESKSFGTMIGSAARMFEGLALGQGHERTDLVSTKNQSNTASYGAGLVQTLGNWFPELRRFQGRMEKSLKLSHEEASASYVEQLSKIRAACHCGICTTKDKLQPDQEGVPPAHGYCLAALAETIISLGLSLSRMTVASRLYPTRPGIQSFYLGQVSKRLEARGLHWSEHFKIVYGTEWNAPDARRLRNAVQIFTGSRPVKDTPGNMVALSHEGICAYFVSLETSYESDQEQQVKLMRVVSGSINVGEKLFNRACLGPVDEADPEDPWEEIQYDHLPQPLFCK